jgi:hypothetical protein
MQLVFVVGACVLVLGLVLAIRQRELPLRSQSGLQAVREEAAQMGEGAGVAVAAAGSAAATFDVPDLVPESALAASGDGQDISPESTRATGESVGG